ncbi:MAG: DUF503 domain-containing protein [Clostridiales bacterium]|nr:DUF503 domain-containing protein [Clostridiales bacterium]MCF8022258.1 DUF503 domain-containing protein [Clostridiales bacterium]
MVVGVLTIEIHMGMENSLKGKRRILKSLIDRLKSKFNVSVSEVDKQDFWQVAVLGVSTVSNESAHAHKMMSKVINFIEMQGEIELIDYTTELL